MSMLNFSKRIEALEVKHKPAPSFAILTEYKGTFTFKHHDNEYTFDTLSDYQQFYKSIPDQPNVLNIHVVNSPRE